MKRRPRPAALSYLAQPLPPQAVLAEDFSRLVRSPRRFRRVRGERVRPEVLQ